MLHGLDLFSGTGSLSLALDEWVRPLAYCEIDTYAQGILLSRISSGDLPSAPIWDDIRTFNGEPWRNEVDIIYGGFPCQDISSAGNGDGLSGSRSGLFFEMLRVAKEIKPTFLFLENVPAIRTRGLDRVAIQLSRAGYDCRWTNFSASEVGAPHQRERWFCLAKHTDHKTTNTIRTLPERKATKPNRISWCETQSGMVRVVDGCTNRLDRIKALGNGVVPDQAKEAFKLLMGLTISNLKD